MPSTVSAAASGSPPMASWPSRASCSRIGIGERAEAARGEGAQRAGHLVERPDAGDVGDGDIERHAALEPAQARRHRGRWRRRRARRRARPSSSVARSAPMASGPRRHRSVIKIGFCRAVSVKYGLLPNRASSNATPGRIVRRRAACLVPSRPRHVPPLWVVRSRQASGRKPRHAMRGSGKLLQSGGTLAQARRHRQEVGSIGLGQANLSGVCARSRSASCLALAVLVVVAGLRLMAGPVDLDFLKARIAEAADVPGNDITPDADRISLEWGGLSQPMRLVFTGLRFTNGQNQVIATAPKRCAHLRSAQRLPGHAPADLDHHRAADHRGRDRPRRRHDAPHLRQFERAVARRGGGDPGRAAAGRAQLQIADRPARHGPDRAGETYAARCQDGHHLGRPVGARAS